eukprot:1156358-Pelagomonas_calceolata.AAC.4
MSALASHSMQLSVTSAKQKHWQQQACDAAPERSPGRRARHSLPVCICPLNVMVKCIAPRGALKFNRDHVAKRDLLRCGQLRAGPGSDAARLKVSGCGRPVHRRRCLLLQQSLLSTVEKKPLLRSRASADSPWGLDPHIQSPSGSKDGSSKSAACA